MGYSFTAGGGRPHTCAAVTAAVALLTAAHADTVQKKDVDAASPTTAVYSLPPSSLRSKQSIAIDDYWTAVVKAMPPNGCGTFVGKNATEIAATRKCQAESFYKIPYYTDLLKLYQVRLVDATMGGVPVEIVTPSGGIAARNSNRVLISLHGGGFIDGSRTYSRLEAIPVAAVGRIKVVSVDYRMAPIYKFPAASEDVEAVYRELLKTYDPKSIGIFGCSAGGLLTAESIAWLQSKNVPLPGAVGMFCSGGAHWSEGDSAQFSALWQEKVPQPARDDAYFKNVDFNDPLAFPVRSKEVMAKFPPSLLIASTRDHALSSVVYTHTMLVRQKVPAQLYIWEGMYHAFVGDPLLPEAQEAYDVIAKFFDQNLRVPGTVSQIDSKH